MRTPGWDATMRAARWLLALLALCAAISACSTRTDVSVSGNVPTQYSHLYLTVQQVWFNTSATAGPGDTGWHKYTLTSPETVDLVALTNGNLTQFANQLNVPLATYKQMRLVLSDSTSTLQSAAQSAGATYNNEVDYVDSSGTSHQVPLQVPNAAEGIAVPLSLSIEAGGTTVLNNLGDIQNLGLLAANPCSSTFNESSSTFGASNVSCNTNCAVTGLTSTSTFGSTNCTGTTATTAFGTTTTTSGTTTTTPCTTSTGATGTTTFITTGNNAGTTPCEPTTTTSTSTACAQGTIGTTSTTGTLCTNTTISGAVSFDAMRDLVAFNANGTSGYVWSSRPQGYDLSQSGTIQGQLSSTSVSLSGVMVMAETLSADGSRFEVVAAAPVQSSGSFVLYPLSTESGAPAQYDLVISGPGVQTTIIQDVPVSVATPSQASTVQLGASLQAANTFTVNVSSTSPAAVRGGWVGFYQTLPVSGSAPYLITAQPLDPITGTFDTAVTLSSGPIVYGVYSSSGITYTSVDPTEGQTSYHVAQSVPVYADGPMSTLVSAGASSPVLFSLPAYSVPSGASAASVSGSISVGTPGKYNRGILVLTHDGAIVSAAKLDSYLGSAQTSGITFFSSLPGSDAGALYYAEAWVWNSSDPASTFSREPYSGSVDLRSGSASGVAISVQ